ncbi:MAG: type II secretion system F family protein [Methanobrevibacter sp.]|nr:type II secretion system F family protein [Methanobrevibacter sp.]
MNKDNNLNNEDNKNNKVNFANKEIFKISNLLKNDSIFEELEKRYSNNSSSNLSNSYNQSQNIFTSLKNSDYGNDESDANMNENKSDGNSNGFIENIKEKLIHFLLNNSYIEINESNFYNSLLRIIIIIFSILTLIAALISYFISLELGLAIFFSFLLISFAIFYFPKMKKQNDYASFSKELPYALRQLATELRSGKSLFDSMNSIVDSDYGVLSMEFSRVLEEIKYGESTENAFVNLDDRVDSQALSRVI